MSLMSQELGPDDFKRHLRARVRQKAKRRKIMIAGLTLTSMVDMFSLLVIFLLQSFSSSPELLVVSKGVILPNAATAKEIKDAPVLGISEAGIFLDQKKVGELLDLVQNPKPLTDKLLELRQIWQKTHPGQEFKGEINLQADRGLPGLTVSHFMALLPGQNYNSIELAVISGAK